MHSDEATVPDWNINMLEKGKKGECACVCVNVASDSERALHFREQHIFPQAFYCIAASHTAGCLTLNLGSILYSTMHVHEAVTQINRQLL